MQDAARSGSSWIATSLGGYLRGTLSPALAISVVEGIAVYALMVLARRVVLQLGERDLVLAPRDKAEAWFLSFSGALEVLNRGERFGYSMRRVFFAVAQSPIENGR